MILCSLFFLSGFAALAYEMVWLRRLGLVLGGTAVGAAVTVGLFMAGLAIGSGVTSWLAGTRLSRMSSRVAIFGALEGFIVLWALLFPTMLAWCWPLVESLTYLRWCVPIALLLPPTICMGATWPVVAMGMDVRSSAAMYAANLSGAVCGILAATFGLLRGLGVRGTEIFGGTVGAAVVVGACLFATLTNVEERGLAPDRVETGATTMHPQHILIATFIAGFAALGMEMVWVRLAAVALGASVQTMGLVFATFLACVAVGAWVGRRWPKQPRTGLGIALWGLGIGAVLGAMVLSMPQF